MNCIIVDDEPIARKGMQSLIEQIPELSLSGTFNNATSAAAFINDNVVDLIFLDIQMPQITGLEFARTIKKNTLIVFTTAYSEYALDSYEVDAIDYLVKPIEFARFEKAVSKAIAYNKLLEEDVKDNIENVASEHIFVKSDRRYFKVNFKDILFIEGLKDYVIIQLQDQRVITKMNLKTIHELLPKTQFFRINKSYIVNTTQIESLDNNDVFIRNYEIAIGNSYRDAFFDNFVLKK